MTAEGLCCLLAVFSKTNWNRKPTASLELQLAFKQGMKYDKDLSL